MPSMKPGMVLELPSLGPEFSYFLFILVNPQVYNMFFQFWTRYPVHRPVKQHALQEECTDYPNAA